MQRGFELARLTKRKCFTATDTMALNLFLRYYEPHFCNRCFVCSITVTREWRTLQFRFEFVTDNGSDSLRRLDFPKITMAFNDDLEKPLEQ